MRKLHTSKKASALTYAFIYVFFNVLVFIIISSFGQDGYNVGTYGNQLANIETNTTEDISVTKASGWFSGFATGFHELPSFMKTLFVVFQVSGLALIIYGLIRGI